MESRNHIVKAVGALICMAAASCSSLSQPSPDKAYFAIDPGPFSASSTEVRSVSADPPALRIRGLHVVSPYDQLAFVYREAGDQFCTDYYNNFISSPDQMLSTAITTWFAHDHQFGYVGNGTGEMPIQYTLSGDVIALYGDYTDAHAPKASITIRAVLQDSSSKVLFQREYSASAPIELGNAKSLVQGWDQALRQILQHLTVDLGK